MDTDALIEELAKEIGVGEAALKKWRQRGVSYRRREEIRELAERRGITIPRSAFDEFGKSPDDPTTDPSPTEKAA